MRAGAGCSPNIPANHVLRSEIFNRRVALMASSLGRRFPPFDRRFCCNAADWCDDRVRHRVLNAAGSCSSSWLRRDRAMLTSAVHHVGPPWQR